MTDDLLIRANEIQKEIFKLKDYIDIAKNPRRIDLFIKENTNMGENQYYGITDKETPECVQSILTDQLEFIRLQLIQKVERKIEELQTEFNNL